MNPVTLACVNGELVPADRATIPIWDRGFLFGDAVYEVMRLYRGRCWLETAHYARLKRSLREMDFRPVDLEQLKVRVEQTIAASGVGEGTVYIHITRGVAPRHHAFPGPEVAPTELIVARPYDEGSTTHLRAEGASAISYPDLRWKRCDVKSTNLLPNVLANEAAHRAGAYEAILVGPDGRITEATHSSLLWVRGGRLEGTPDGPGILPGTTRQLVHRLCEEDHVPFAEAELALAELLEADEVLLVGTTIEVLPVVKVDQTPIASGRPGPIALRLQAAYRRAVERWLAAEPAAR